MPKLENILRFNLQKKITDIYKKIGIYQKGMFWYFDEVMKFLIKNDISGDYFEFGVYDGRSFVRYYNIAKKYKLDMNFVAFDSFEGLPELTNDDGGHNSFFRGAYCYSKENFIKNLKRHKVDISRVKNIEGFYETALVNVILPKKASFIYIDCDLYSSTQLVLDFIIPYLQDGTVIGFDDWYAYKGNKRKGVQRAWYEWVEKYDIVSTPFIDFRTFIINQNLK